MAEAAYITLLFAAALAVVGILGEISGFRAIVCSRGNEDFARRGGACRHSLWICKSLAGTVTRPCAESAIQPHTVKPPICALVNGHRRKTRAISRLEDRLSSGYQQE